MRPCLLACLFLLVSAPAALAGAARDLRLERTEVIVAHDYRELPRMGPNGELGFNKQGRSTFSVAHQRVGDLFVRAGIVRNDPAVIEQGFKAFDYAFSRQRPDGSFPDADQAEEYAFFVEAVAHSILLLEETSYGERYGDRLRRYTKRLTDAMPHITADDAWGAFRYRNQFYTHSAYVMGSALTLLSELKGSERAMRYGKAAIRMGLSRQWGSGVNPELEGHDVRYHMVGLHYAQRFPVYFPRSRLTPRVSRMITDGLGWMALRIDADGWIDWNGSTRACREISVTTGRPKTPGYEFSIRGFAYWGALVGSRWRVRKAEAAHRYATQAEDLCGPKETFGGEADGVAGARADDPGSGTLDPTLEADLYE